MTNRDMVKPGLDGPAPGKTHDGQPALVPEPNDAPLPPMPAAEGENRVFTDREPADSPQLHPRVN